MAFYSALPFILLHFLNGYICCLTDCCPVRFVQLVYIYGLVWLLFAHCGLQLLHTTSNNTSISGKKQKTKTDDPVVYQFYFVVAMNQMAENLCMHMLEKTLLPWLKGY